MNIYKTWDDKREIRVTYYQSNLKRWKAEACVARTFQPSNELWVAFFRVNEGIVYRPGMTQAERNRWMHLYDAVCCESVSPGDAWAALKDGRVPENLTVRASNYMHLV